MRLFSFRNRYPLAAGNGNYRRDTRGIDIHSGYSAITYSGGMPREMLRFGGRLDFIYRRAF